VGTARTEPVWGGEVFHGGAHPAGLLPVPMPGADLATKFPMRMVAGILYGAIDDERLLGIMEANMGATEAQVILKQVERKVNVAYSSSAGRVLDAVAALLGVCYRRTYEGEPAMKLESFAYTGDADKVKLPCEIIKMNGRNVVDSRSMLRAILDAMGEGRNRHDDRGLGPGIARQGLRRAGVRGGEKERRHRSGVQRRRGGQRGHRPGHRGLREKRGAKVRHEP